jgi:hypothetical protein
VPRLLRARASALEKTIDDCKDWEKPATSGIYMVVCDEASLNRYVESGLEEPGSDGVQIEAIDAGNVSTSEAGEEEEPLPVPAVRRNRSGTYLDDWQISAARPTEATVFASCPSDGGVVFARFTEVPLGFGEALTIDDAGPGGTWTLTTGKGSAVAETLPYTTKAKDGLLVKKAPVPGKSLRCQR